MRKSVFLFTLAFATQVQAAPIRCGTDAFGNAVCMDKDGVVTIAPREPVRRPAGGDSRGNEASAGAVGESSREGRDDQQGSARCGTDPFGNTVCR